jgi:hypothetical protein
MGFKSTTPVILCTLPQQRLLIGCYPLPTLSIEKEMHTPCSINVQQLDESGTLSLGHYL